ncbi:hypothetical protein [Streptomyces sp. CA-111067]|uniref:hypothetical protein n=1 Tax=Streptomyces sp. CA-111067 TaxID=3240046 RepID=UPI003D966003
MPWGTTRLARYMQQDRINHGISMNRNVAAIEYVTADGTRMTVVTASTGNLVKNRVVVFDVYRNGVFLRSEPRDDFLESKWKQTPPSPIASSTASWAVPTPAGSCPRPTCR